MTQLRTIEATKGTAKGAEQGAVPGVSPNVFANADFERIAAVVHQEAGIVLTERKKMLVYSRIVPLVRKSGHQAFADFLPEVECNAALMKQMVEALTTNHTYFNREPHHFTHFTETVRHQLIARAGKGEKVRLWSAGCSSGEEIWTLMLTLMGTDPAEGRRIAQQDIVALASDLSSEVLASAKAATYPSDAFEKMPPALVRNWCDDAGAGTLAIAKAIRSMVRFRRLNLLSRWPFANRFDVIFCRNVMIYFDEAAKDSLTERFARQLKPGGYLYIGHSERISGGAASLVEPVGPTVYRRHAQ